MYVQHNVVQWGGMGTGSALLTVQLSFSLCTYNCIIIQHQIYYHFRHLCSYCVILLDIAASFVLRDATFVSFVSLPPSVATRLSTVCWHSWNRSQASHTTMVSDTWGVCGWCMCVCGVGWVGGWVRGCVGVGVQYSVDGWWWVSVGMTCQYDIHIYPEMACIRLGENAGVMDLAVKCTLQVSSTVYV